jgi:hypothetical protein
MKSIGQIFIFSILKTFTRIFLITFCLQCHSLQLLGQFLENFDDNDLTSNPLWTGMPQDFVVGSGILQLAAPAVNATSFITTSSTIRHNTAWEFRIEMRFNPSGSNFARVFLTSDQENLNQALNGYFVLIGNSSDEISLYKQSGLEKIKIIDGTDGRLDTENVEARVVVTCSGEGEWNLFTAVAEENLTLEGTAIDEEPFQSLFTGIQCVYTSSRSDKFLFDDFFVSLLPDSLPPQINELRVPSSTEVLLLFNEKLQEAGAVTRENYLLSDRTTPTSAHLLDNKTDLLLRFEEEFVAGNSYSLIVQNVADSAGNQMNPDTISFRFLPRVDPSFKDIVVTEILADPTPTLNLPEAEFIELYNRSSNAFDISGWQLSDGNTTGIVKEQVVLLPGEYVVITSASSVSKFPDQSHAIGIEHFPSLNNGGDKIVLKTGDGRKIDSVAFSSSWYRDSEKIDGGWTLEIIDPDNLCGTGNNWIGSDDENGGTPGQLNSVDAENLDLTGPELLHALVVSPDTVRLIFNEPLSSVAPSRDEFSLNPSKEISNVILHPSLNIIDLTIAPPITIGETTTLRVGELSDCSGNLLGMNSTSVQIIFPEHADSLDILINEILFNPRTNGVDFVELLNSSSRYINLAGWSLANLEDGQIKNIHGIGGLQLFINPNEHLAFSPARDVLLSEYPAGSVTNNYDNDLPPLNDEMGSIALINPDGRLMDVLFYSEEMHSIFVKDNEGVSLERVNPGAPTNATSNWKSSASKNGYATPGYRNSNAVEGNPSGQEVEVIPEIFAPISGQPDFAIIAYNLGSGGFVGTVRIYDQNSRLVRTIAENVLLGSYGFFRWDGDRDNGARAAIGNYMIRFEIFNAEGTTRVIRKRVAIAGDL